MAAITIAVLGAVLTLLTGAVGWAMATVIRSKEQVLLLASRLGAVEEKLREAISLQDVRDSIDEVLSRREAAQDVSRRERDELNQFRIRETITAETGKAMPKVIAELRAEIKSGLGRISGPVKIDEVK